MAGRGPVRGLPPNCIGCFGATDRVSRGERLSPSLAASVLFFIVNIVYLALSRAHAFQPLFINGKLQEIESS